MVFVHMCEEDKKKSTSSKNNNKKCVEPDLKPEHTHKSKQNTAGNLVNWMFLVPEAAPQIISIVLEA